MFIHHIHGFTWNLKVFAVAALFLFHLTMTKEAKVWALQPTSDPKGMGCHSCLPPRVEQKRGSMWVLPPIVIINPSQVYFKGLGVSEEYLTLNEYTHSRNWHIISHERREGTHCYRL